MNKKIGLLIGCAVLVSGLWLGACSDDTSNQPLPEAGQDAAPSDASLETASDMAAPDSTLPDAPSQATCKAGDKAGPKGATNGETTTAGVKYNVRTPDNYDPKKGHPLIVVYAAAGGTADNMEPFTGLTPYAKAGGYVIAYVNHVSPNASSYVDDIATVPTLVAKRWCIDTSRVYLTGHSDGATVIYVMMARGKWAIVPAAIAPSAAGMNTSSFTQVPCFKRPLPVIVLHSTGDTLFPAATFGRAARDWWVKCNKCSTAAGKPLADGCLPYGGCSATVEVQYCEGAAAHGYWPQLNKSMMAFFGRFRASP